MKNLIQGRGRRPLPGTALLGGALVLSLTACDLDTILDVDDPEFATPESLDNPAGVPVTVAGAIGDFQIAYSGAGNDAYLSVSSLLGDEFYQSDTFETRRATDQREQNAPAQGNTSDAAFNRLQYARRSLLDAEGAISAHNVSTARLPELRALRGYTYLALADGWCSAVPFSQTLKGGVPSNFGSPVNTRAVYDSAIAIFNQALNHNLAAVGKGRALLAQGRYQEAGAAVANVPDNFVYFVLHSVNSTRQNNPIFALMDNGRYGVSDDEGGATLVTVQGGNDGAGLEYRRDPRIVVSDPRAGFDPNIVQYVSRLYPDLGADVPIASGVEARLIEAEAALQTGNTTRWLQILNSLRSNFVTLMRLRYPTVTFTGTLPALTDPGNARAREDLMFAERAYWLYNTGIRLGDMRRLVREYKRPQEQVYPSGPFHRGGVYGNDVTFPVPFDEVNNPNYQHSQCDVDKA